MLTSIALRDFKNHHDTQLELGNLVCLVGPNASGKTGILEAIHLACTSLGRGATTFFQPPYSFEDFVRQGCQEFQVRINATLAERTEQWIAYTLTGQTNPAVKPKSPGAIPVETPRYRVSVDWETNWKPGEDDPFEHLSEPSGTGANITINSFGHTGTMLPDDYPTTPARTFMFSPNLQRLRSPSYIATETPAMNADGSSTASVIAYLMTAEPERYDELLSRVRSVLPGLQRLRVRPARVGMPELLRHGYNPESGVSEVIGHELLFDLKAGTGIPARAMSEGTLLVTALLTAVVWNENADYLLIDDLDKGLHPKAQRELINTIKKIQASNPDLQIAFSTHSPYIVDELNASEVWIVAADQDGQVHTRRLSDHPDAARALEVLTTGEFLSAEGEDWVLESIANG